MESGMQLNLDSRNAEEKSGLKCVDLSPTNLPNGQNAGVHRSKETTEDRSALKYRRYRSRLGGVKARHKRQVLQDMARPLKHWLYKHRDNPYPTKTEKVLLALGSHMTLVQVSNWFANARRRLKNTVRQPDLSWALRIKLYNKYIQGNAERLSVCSDDTDSDDEECTQQTPISQTNFGRSSSHQAMLESEAIPDCPKHLSPPSKYKNSLLNRYLNDTLRLMIAANSNGAASTCKRRSLSASFSSNECDQDVVSPASSFETETNFIYHMDTTDDTSNKSDTGQQEAQSPQRRDNQDWREIHAAVALTSLAQSRARAFGTATGQSWTREALSLPRPTITRPAPAPQHTAGTTLASRIIQKSSHISEVQTVQAPLANSG